MNGWGFDPPEEPGSYWALERTGSTWTPRIVHVVERIWQGRWWLHYERKQLGRKTAAMEWVRVRRRPKAIMWGPPIAIPGGVPAHLRIRMPSERGRYLAVALG